MIKYSDHTINISTKIIPTRIDSFNCYQFLCEPYSYYSSPPDRNVINVVQTGDSILFQALKTSILFINEKRFTGYLKFAKHYVNAQPHGYFSGNDVFIYQFKDGIFERVDKTNLDGNFNNSIRDMTEKPVLYLYPTQIQNINVQINLIHHQFTHTYPTYNNGWEVQAQPNGTLINKATGKEHYCLFWETTGAPMINSIDSGFVVKGNETAKFLEEKLIQLGLNAKETNEFIIYWLPQMENNSYNAIYFANTAYEKISQLNITPKPNHTIRIMMLWQALEHPIDLFPQQLPAIPKREGFTAVEWGGTKVDNFIKNP